MNSGIKETEAEIDTLFKNAEKAFRTSGDDLKNFKKTETDKAVLPLKEKLKILKNNKANHIVNRATADVQK